ncbi:MAG: type II secretion system protein [Candidatus Sungbacteria bacterium]|nr:type II secretion system protein [Candidatus Sungbacteria bacterium]
MRRDVGVRAAFTLVEMLVVIAIMIMIGVLGLGVFSASRDRRDLTTSGQSAISVLRLAQSHALAGTDNEVWGVRLGQGVLTLFRGTTFAGSTDTQDFALPSSVELVNVNLSGGGIDVVFNRIVGTTATFGTFEVRVRSSPASRVIVTIDGSGKVYAAATALPTTDTRIIDTRHRSFNLGWSIRSAATLRLTFANPPDPDVVQDIPMAGYLSGSPPTKFDWSGTFAVGGENQTMRIHTTFLDGFNTILSIDRDCRTNTKQVIIAIDGNVIATYTADCAMVTVGPLGGIMTEP